MSIADREAARQAVLDLCIDLHPLRSILGKKLCLTTLRGWWKKVAGKQAEVVGVVTPWLDPLAAARDLPYCVGEMAGACAADAVLRLWKNEVLGAFMVLTAAREEGNPIWRRLEAANPGDVMGPADAEEAEAEDDNGAGRLMAAWHFLGWMRHLRGDFRLYNVRAEVDFEFARLAQAAIIPSPGKVGEDETQPGPMVEPRPNKPNVSYCLPRHGVIRWDGETEAEPRLCRLLRFLLNRRLWPAQFDDFTEDLELDENYNGKGLKDKTIHNRVNDLTNLLESIKFPYEYSSKGGQINREIRRFGR